MLTKLGQRGYAVREALGEYRVSQFDTDTDKPANDTQADKLFNLLLQRYQAFQERSPGFGCSTTMYAISTKVFRIMSSDSP